MIDQLKDLAEEKLDRLEMVSVDKIQILRNELAELQQSTELNGFHQWVINKLYRFKIPEFARSVIITATPAAASYANITFYRNKKKYELYGIVNMPVEKTKRYITTAVKKMGYTIQYEPKLPLKRLAVQSGLAEYGKNNITYVKGMGSFIGYGAFYTDIPCEQDSWRKPVVAKECAHCDKCINVCPARAIKKDNFIFDVGCCLSLYNENTNDFPEWFPKTAHHTPFDCLKCQVNCPMNVKNLTTADVTFSEAETKRILRGRPYNDVSKELKSKITLLQLDSWASIPRNLKMLFDLMDTGFTPSLS